MNEKIFIPPIKCQGIKTKLLPFIAEVAAHNKYNRWIEPFLGSGVVGFNIRPRNAFFSDSNPHIIEFYNALKRGLITPKKMHSFLEKEGQFLEKSNGEHYYEVRERFNANANSYDFIFLNRACFNGMMRFNSKGKFNVPFCKKPNRFSKAYVTKIANQIKYIQEIILANQYNFICQSYENTLAELSEEDLIYCDPPYLGRHVDYFDSWTEDNENTLHMLLMNSKSKFILSTWFSNAYRKNKYVESLWSGLNIVTIEHYYHVGGSEKNRNPVTEALITNFDASLAPRIKTSHSQLFLFSDELLLGDTEKMTFSN